MVVLIFCVFCHISVVVLILCVCVFVILIFCVVVLILCVRVYMSICACSLDTLNSACDLETLSHDRCPDNVYERKEHSPPEHPCYPHKKERYEL